MIGKKILIYIFSCIGYWLFIYNFSYNRGKKELKLISTKLRLKMAITRSNNTLHCFVLFTTFTYLFKLCWQLNSMLGLTVMLAHECTSLNPRKISVAILNDLFY